MIETTIPPETRRFLRSVFDAAVRAADPRAAIIRHLPAPAKGRTIVIGAGKASAQMAAILESAWNGPLEGLVVTRYGFGVPCRQIEVIEANHPVPDGAGLVGARRLLEIVSGLTKDDLVIAMISGGGSALLPAPAGALTLDDEIAVNEALLTSGAPISTMNTIRKHISRIKGGRLAAAAYPARVVSFVVSDIPGDDPALVASGPTVAGAGSRKDALAAIELYRLQLPTAATAHLQTAAANGPLPDDPRFARNEVHVVASAALSLEAAAKEARRQGIKAAILSDSIEGEARDVACVHAAIAREIAMRNRPFPKPALLLSGGETTVTIRGKGKGGRNSEFLISLAIELGGLPSVHALAADTDGIDGTEDNAGAFIDAGTLDRMRRAGLDPRAVLRNNDAWSAFHATGDLLITGPTGTNVNDFRAILIL
jgi:hydroxypyruvate reductase